MWDIHILKNPLLFEIELGALHFYLLNLATLFHVEAKEKPRALKAWGHLGLKLNPHKDFRGCVVSAPFHTGGNRHREVIKVSQDHRAG